MKRKSGSLFWGGFFLALGTLILLNKFDMINSDWDFVWSLFPVALVFIGVMIIARDSIVRPITALLFGGFVAVLAYGSVNNIIYNVDFNWDDVDYKYESANYSEEYKPEYKYGELDFGGGAGYFKIVNTTDKLVEGSSYGSFGNYYFNTSDDQNTAYITFNQRKKHFRPFEDDFKNRLEIKLNPEVIWDLDMKFGAAKARYDLTEFQISRVNIETGVSEVYLKLGEKYPEVKVDVSMGAASLEINIPKNSGCKLTGEMVLMSKDLENFVTKYDHDKKYYVTKNYEESTNKIYVKVEAGVAELDITTY